MKNFNHINVKTIDEAVILMKKYKGKSKLIAGGTDLLGELKDRVLLTYPETLVNIKTIHGLDYIKEEAGVLKIGALTRLQEIATSAVVKKRYDILAQAALSIGSPQIRSMGTIGGNLCQDVRCWYYRYPHQMGGRIMCRRKGSGSCLAVSGDNRYHAIMESKECFAVCPSDTAVALASLDANIKIAGPGYVRTIPTIEFYHSLGNDLKIGEMVTEIQVSQPPEMVRQTFLKFRLRDAIDFAIVSVASVVTVSGDAYEDARIVLGAVAPGPIRAVEAEQSIRGKAVNAAMAEAVSEIAMIGARPLSMNAYKVEITKTLIKRAILS